MNKYRVHTSAYIISVEDIEAENELEAADKSGSRFTLCHQCESQYETTDPVTVTVYDMEGNFLYEDNW